MSKHATHWQLDPAITFLNHGSFGACPTVVLEAQQALRAELEWAPVRFMLGELPGRLAHVRARIGAFVGADPGDLALLPNATTGVNTVLQRLDWAPGDAIVATDHEYQACRRSLDYLGDRFGVTVQIARIPFPGTTDDSVVEAVLGAISDRTRLALLDHVTSQTALVLPIARLVDALKARGIETLVDGAHGPGMVPVDLDALGAAYYTANLHKWCCAPKGAAFLHARRDRQPGLHPLVISHGYRPEGAFRAEFDWTGTDDPTAWLVVPTALDAMAALLPGGWPALREANRTLALQGRRIVAAALGCPLPCPDAMIGSMATLPIPDADSAPPSGLEGWEPDQRALFLDHRIEMPIVAWPHSPKRVLRVSAQLYNDLDDYHRLARALPQVLR